MKILYKKNNSVIRYNKELDIYSIKTQSGVVSFNGEVLREIKEDSGLVRAIIEKILF